MARLSPKLEVVRSLFARSGNKCAFPGCDHVLVNDNHQFVAQICHIESAAEGGERFNPDSSDEQRRSFDNLLIMCYQHHVETDDIAAYPANQMKEIKASHERRFKSGGFSLSEADLMKITSDMEEYWSTIDRLNKLEHQFLNTELVMEVDGRRSFADVLSSIAKALSGIESMLEHLASSDANAMNDFYSLLDQKEIGHEVFADIPYFENPFENRNWEYHNIGRYNWLQRVRIDLVQLEVLFLDAYLKTNTEDAEARSRFENAKEDLKEFARSAMHVD